MATDIADEEQQSKEGFIRGLGLLDSTMIVAGSMIGSGIFIVSADIARQVGSPGLAASGLDHHGLAHHRRGAFLRRAGGDDAESRRDVRLPKGSVRLAVGLSLRLDAFYGDRHRDDRGGRRRVQPVYGHSHSADFRIELHNRAGAHRIVELRGLALDRPVARDRDDRLSDGDQHARAESSARLDPKRFHVCEDRFADRFDRIGDHRRARFVSGNRGGEFRRSLDDPWKLTRRWARFDRRPLHSAFLSDCASPRRIRSSPPTHGTTSRSPRAR